MINQLNPPVIDIQAGNCRVVHQPPHFGCALKSKEFAQQDIIKTTVTPYRNLIGRIAMLLEQSVQHPPGAFRGCFFHLMRPVPPSG